MLYKINMTDVYTILYINTDEANGAEVLGVYTTKIQAVLQLLERANYREKNGQLTQYMQPTDEYRSFDALRQKVEEDMELHDVDIYKITVHRLDDK